MSKKKRNNKPQQSKKDFQYRSNSKRAKRQIEKQSNQRIDPVPSKSNFSPNDLSYGISQLEPLFSEANRRIEYITSQGFTSFAINKVVEEGGKDFFDIDGIDSREALLEQMYRVRVFLNDKGSTIEGAKLETSQINAALYKGKFGNEYYTKENNYARYDTSVIDKNAASRAFESYRKLEKTQAGKFALDGSYGSENLITALYDAEIRGFDSLVYGNDLLEQYQHEQNKLFEKSLADADETESIYGRNYDNITGRYGF